MAILRSELPEDAANRLSDEIVAELYPMPIDTGPDVVPSGGIRP